MAGGAGRPVARATDEDAGPVADDNAEGPVARGGDAARSLADDSAEEPVAGGAIRPVTSAADEDASVGPITEGTKPVARAVGPITEGAKRRMSQSSLSACLHRQRSWPATSCG